MAALLLLVWWFYQQECHAIQRKLVFAVLFPVRALTVQLCRLLFLSS